MSLLVPILISPAVKFVIVSACHDSDRDPLRAYNVLFGSELNCIYCKESKEPMVYYKQVDKQKPTIFCLSCFNLKNRSVCLYLTDGLINELKTMEFPQNEYMIPFNSASIDEGMALGDDVPLQPKAAGAPSSTHINISDRFGKFLGKKLEIDGRIYGLTRCGYATDGYDVCNFCSHNKSSFAYVAGLDDIKTGDTVHVSQIGCCFCLRCAYIACYEQHCSSMLDKALCKGVQTNSSISNFFD